MLYKKENQVNKKVLVYCLSVLILCNLSVILFFIEKSCTERSILDVVAIIVSMVGTLLIVFQLWDSKDITCCDMLAEMNCRFSENERILNLYQKLEEQYRVGINVNNAGNVNYDGISSSDIMAYCSFFEVLYEYVEHGIISIKQMDDLFGYRFFIFVHSKFIQERELFAVPSSYVNIYRLYAKWSKYRRNHSLKVGLVVEDENAIPVNYLTRGLYLEERIYQDFQKVDVSLLLNVQPNTFLLKRLSLGDYNRVVDFLDNISKAKEKCITISPVDYQESVLVDYVYGIFFKEELVAVCICVLNRKTKRNLGYKFLSKNYKNVITVETLEVNSNYRSLGIEKVFSEYLVKLQKKLQVASICYRKICKQ